MQAQASERRPAICVASGYGVKVYVERGHLIIHDGIGDDRQTRRYPRANSRLKRIAVIGHTGFVTLEALRWIKDVGASFSQIDADGQLIAVTAGERHHHVKLRRGQVLAPESDAGRRAMLELLEAKLHRQAELVERIRHLRPTLKTHGKTREVSVSHAIAEQVSALRAARSFAELRKVEAQAGRYYWQTWARFPIRFESRFRKTVPEHWHRAGPRYPAAKASARPDKAQTPAQALLNYSYAILETEATIALQQLGFDPSLGLMHSDRYYRPSLASDLMEAVRPVADEAVLDLLEGRQLRRGDVFETRQGVCRLGPSLVRELADQALGFRRALGPHAEQLARTLLNAQDLPTPLTRDRHGESLRAWQKTSWSL